LKYQLIQKKVHSKKVASTFEALRKGVSIDDILNIETGQINRFAERHQEKLLE